MFLEDLRTIAGIEIGELVDTSFDGRPAIAVTIDPWSRTLRGRRLPCQPRKHRGRLRPVAGAVASPGHRRGRDADRSPDLGIDTE